MFQLTQLAESELLCVEDIRVKEYHYYLLGEVGSASDYVDFMHALNTANEHDTVYIHINSPGGNLETAIQLVNCIRNCSAKVVTIIEGEAASAASIIFFAAEEFVVMPHTSMMIHTWSGVQLGKSHEMSSHLAHFIPRSEKFMRDVYKDFLTEDEYASINKGVDLYFDSEEIVRRIKQMVPDDAPQAETAAAVEQEQ